MNSPLVQKRSVAAAEINQPKLTKYFADESTHAGANFWRLQHDLC
jgi:hypothetical protein